MRFENLTQERKERTMSAVDACLALGGGALSPQTRQDISDVLDGKKTTEQVRQEILIRHGVIKP